MAAEISRLDGFTVPLTNSTIGVTATASPIAPIRRFGKDHTEASALASSAAPTIADRYRIK